uniref:S-locus cysteine-rich protein 25 n=1 Tax=Arabidopsis lyrata TaxID=59689 RepID=C7FE09_ARALY|nr:S-locus cysteine-rich protein 25 [Arabidopsis lyrata]
MRCAALFMIFCVLIVFHINHGKEVDAQKWKACRLRETFSGTCGHDGEIRCKNDITRNGGSPLPFECHCEEFRRKRVCHCDKCLL